jgi:hypothetical protein
LRDYAHILTILRGRRVKSPARGITAIMSM